MNRRTLLYGLAGAGLTAGGAWVATNGLSPGDGLPVRVETMDAPGSSAGSIRVPVQGTVTVIDLFATWCAPCRAQMESLGAVHGGVDDVAFVSVTNERIGGTLTREDVRAWWRENGGNWTLGLDPESRLMAALSASGLPFTAIADAGGRIAWSHTGVVGPDRLRAAIEAARR